MRSVKYSSLGKQAISQLLFGTMFGSPGYITAEMQINSGSNHSSFLLFLTYSYVFFNICEHEN